MATGFGEYTNYRLQAGYFETEFKVVLWYTDAQLTTFCGRFRPLFFQHFNLIPTPTRIDPFDISAFLPDHIHVSIY